MVCYGVGNFSTASAPMWHYACILNLKSDLAIESVFYYDPCTTGLEAEVLKEFQIQAIPENEQGHRLVFVPILFTCHNVLDSCIRMYWSATGNR
jgi:hypothetical protein